MLLGSELNCQTIFNQVLFPHDGDVEHYQSIDRLRCIMDKGLQLNTYHLKLVSLQNPWFLLIRTVVLLKTKEN